MHSLSEEDAIIAAMAMLTSQSIPNPALASTLDQPQLCYALLTITASGSTEPHPVNWALVADASRSMRIPIVDEAQFRALIREGGAQETLVDGVPVWQLTSPVPADVRARTQSALDYVMHALQTMVEHLDARDRFALIVCAETAQLILPGTPGDRRAALAQGIRQLASIRLGDQTDLSSGLQLAIDALRQGRGPERADRLLLLTDGFTQRPDACTAMAQTALGEGISISTVGLGGEFQEDL